MSFAWFEITRRTKQSVQVVFRGHPDANEHSAGGLRAACREATRVHASMGWSDRANWREGP